MNYLGHIYFSKEDFELMHANLFGDFVKGSKLDEYTPIIKEGILLHRKIDDFMGNHQGVKQLSKHLSPFLPKVAPIAIDIYFDHFLAINWEQFHKETLDAFLEKFYDYPLNTNQYNNPLFIQLIHQMKEYRWMNQYSKLGAIDKACIFLSKKLSFQNDMVFGRRVLEENYEVIEQTFFDYMKDAIDYFK
ncbi:MAG: ACP phosphodiesterase [Crocinitomicaceae bacterium]|nr:ACP phosphodiesterase [Crocinitomicaceae bacterium]